MKFRFFWAVYAVLMVGLAIWNALHGDIPMTILMCTVSLTAVYMMWRTDDD